MPVLVAVVFGLVCFAFVVAMAMGDRTLRLILLFSVVVGLAVTVWLFSAKPTDITNEPGW